MWSENHMMLLLPHDAVILPFSFPCFCIYANDKYDSLVRCMHKSFFGTWTDIHAKKRVCWLTGEGEKLIERHQIIYFSKENPILTNLASSLTSCPPRLFFHPLGEIMYAHTLWRLLGKEEGEEVREWHFIRWRSVKRENEAFGREKRGSSRSAAASSSVCSREEKYF